MKASGLIKDLLVNIDQESLRNFLEIQCGFSEAESDSWIAEAQAETDCALNDRGCFQESDRPPQCELVAELQQLDPIAQGCVVIDCLDTQFNLHPNFLDLNFSPLLYQASDRLIQILEEELPSLDALQRRQVVEALLPQLWNLSTKNN